MDAVDRALHDTLVAVRWITETCEHGSVVERDGVTAGIVPSAPERSLFNWVVPSDPAALREHLPALEAMFLGEGVRAFTVWVPEREEETAGWLAGRGHVLDARPLAMDLDLEGFEPPGAGDLDWRRLDSVDDIAFVNDAAYPFDGTPFADNLSTLAGGHGYSAWLDGEPASCLALVDHGDTTVVNLVGTRPTAQRRGLAGRLLGVALAEARERGIRTAALESTKAGRAVYERLGFQPVCELHMWEKRV